MAARLAVLVCVLVMCVVPSARALSWSGSDTKLPHDGTAPEQVIIALTGEVDEMSINWVTFASSMSSIQWGSSSGNLTYNGVGTVYSWIDEAPAHTTRWIHNVVIQGLLPATQYFYRVGDASMNAWSIVFTFTTLPKSSDVVNMIVYGDLGYTNSQSLSSVEAEVASGSVHLILHDGDYAYDLFTNNGSVGDVFLNDIMPLSTRVPYMGCVGNHEMKYNGSHYTNRLSVYNAAGIHSGTGNNWFFSWDYASGGAIVHMIAITTEVYYIYVDEETPPDLTPQMKAQWEWLQQDIKDAKARGASWIIMYGHRPMYCSNVDDMPDCSTDAETLRLGANYTVAPAYPMEVILLNAVDVYIGAHEHSYERCFPVYNGDVDRQDNHTYINPKYPVHILTGSAGNLEDLDYYDDVFFGKFSVVRSSTYGYGHLRVYNSTHLYWDQLLDQGNAGIDTLWIIKDANRINPYATAEATATTAIN